MNGLSFKKLKTFVKWTYFVCGGPLPWKKDSADMSENYFYRIKLIKMLKLQVLVLVCKGQNENFLYINLYQLNAPSLLYSA